MDRPGVYNLSLYRGDSYIYHFLIWDDEALTIPSDLNGVVARAQIRDRQNGALLIEGQCSIVLPNTIVMEIRADDWIDVERRDTGYWDLQTVQNIIVTTLLAGRVEFAGEATL